jgi:U3 small nucleolar RNA-associated protein 21
LIFITRPQTPENITAICEWKDHTLAAWGSEDGKGNTGVWIYKRGQQVGELQKPPGISENITQLLALGSWIVGCGRTKVEVWSSATFEHHTTIHVGQGRGKSTITGGICNMPTYLNKILVGTSDGCLEVWNVSTGKLRYTIFPSESDMGAVTTLEPTPALSLFAIGYASGDVVIHDVRMDKPVISLNAGSRHAPVTTISFRSDGLGAGQDGRKDGIMATATRVHGDVTLWDLNNGGRKMGVLRGAHSPPSTTHGEIAGGISKIEFLPGQGVIITSGMDNALKSWIFDEQPFSPLPRPLHSRSGHAAPVSSLEFLPANADGSEADSKWLMSASRDRSLWAWSLRRDAQSSELSQGNVRKKAKNMGILNNSIAGPDGTPSLEELKAPKITCMASSLNRDGGMGAMPGTKEIWVAPGKHKTASTAESSMTGWESVITGHKGDRFARTWFWGRKRAGRWKFETTDGANVTSVAISPCGTFALLGSEGGTIDMYNLQSGIKRQRFPAPLTKKQAERLKAQAAENPENMEKKFARGQGKHNKAVTGIQVDSVNQTVISCGLDGKLKFWDFNKGVLLHELDWSLTSIRGLRYHRSTDLIALSCNDSSIRVVDIVTKKLVRELWGCDGAILDFAFSNDGRWIIAISEDSVLRIWDLPTGHLIEALRFKSKATALAFSPTGEYLATAHEDSVGVHVWNNRTIFTNVPTRRIAYEDIIDLDAPIASGENTKAVLEAAFEEEGGNEEVATSAPSIDQLSSELLTLSLVPKARWQTLLHLDAIRTRNKPKEPPKAPEKAPFFLPSLDKSKADTSASTALAVTQLEPTPSSHISTLAITGHQSTSAFTSLLLHQPSDVLTHLSSLSPSAADLAIRTLDPSPPYTELTTFVELLTERLREKRDYELCQTWMSVFLACHGSVVLESEELRNALHAWDIVSSCEVKRLGDLVGFCKGVGGWIGGMI